MTLQQLEYIVAIDTYRHYVTAAEKCFVTQPTLTMQIKKLEDEIGQEIFDRSKHPIEPTAIGEQFILKARHVLRESRQLKEIVLSDKKSYIGTFKIGIIPTVAPYLLPLFIGEFAKKYPNTKLIIEEMNSVEIIKSLKVDSIDIGILATPIVDNELREIPMYYEPFSFFGQPNHIAHKIKKLTTETLKTNELWLLSQEHCFRSQLINVCTASKKSALPVAYESGSIESLKNMVRYSGGYTLVPELSITELDSPYIKEFSYPKPSREVSIVVHNSFSKESLINILHKSIIENIPETLTKKEQYIRVNWR